MEPMVGVYAAGVLVAVFDTLAEAQAWANGTGWVGYSFRVY